MTLSKVPGATLEEIDAAIAEECLSCERAKQETHARHREYRAKCRRGHLETLKELRAYRAIIERKLKQQGGAE